MVNGSVCRNLRGDWYRFAFSVINHLGYFDRFTFSDTTLTLFGPDRSQLAYNRYVESLRGEKVLARIITRLPVDGTYYVEVGDPEGHQ